MTRRIIISGLLFTTVVVAGFSAYSLRAAEKDIAVSAAMSVERYPYVTTSVEVVEGSTYGTLMAASGIPIDTANAILAASQDVYDLSRIRLGRTIDLISVRDSGNLLALEYRIDSEEEIIISREDEHWKADRHDIPYTVEERLASGTIETSMYMAGIDAGIDERAIIAASEVFQWSVDFALDVRVGDTFMFLYEERYLDGKYEGPGRVLAAKYVNDGTEYYGFRYVMPDGTVGYFDQEGSSLQKIFLKAPVHFKYITSGFTTGSRYVSAFNVSTGHRAIDYAAPSGTPIRAVGDGVVVSAGWSGPYGNLTSIRHNGTYTTNYAHQSKMAVRRGQHVAQGDIIGYVGSTGFSTGPHLHYEMVKNGVKINPLSESFPSGDPIPEQYREEYLRLVEALTPRLE